MATKINGNKMSLFCEVKLLEDIAGHEEIFGNFGKEKDWFWNGKVSE